MLGGGARTPSEQGTEPYAQIGPCNELQTRPGLPPAFAHMAEADYLRVPGNKPFLTTVKQQSAEELLRDYKAISHQTQGAS